MQATGVATEASEQVSDQIGGVLLVGQSRFLAQRAEQGSTAAEEVGGEAAIVQAKAEVGEGVGWGAQQVSDDSFGQGSFTDASHACDGKDAATATEEGRELVNFGFSSGKGLRVVSGEGRRWRAKVRS